MMSKIITCVIIIEYNTFFLALLFGFGLLLFDEKKILWNESWWNEFYRLLIPSLFILREESMPFDSPTHLSFSLSVFWDLQKKVQFLKILILILIRKEFHFFLSTLFPNYYRCFKIRFYGTLFPFLSHCDIFYSVCHLTIQH